MNDRATGLTYRDVADHSRCRPARPFEVDGIEYGLSLRPYSIRPMIELVTDTSGRDFRGYPGNPATETELKRWTRYGVEPGPPHRHSWASMEAAQCCTTTHANTECAASAETVT